MVLLVATDAGAMNVNGVAIGTGVPPLKLLRITKLKFVNAPMGRPIFAVKFNRLSVVFPIIVVSMFVDTIGIGVVNVVIMPRGPMDAVDAFRTTSRSSRLRFCPNSLLPHSLSISLSK